jgi:hypothetical protein
MPKQQIWYQIEHVVSKNKLIIDKEILTESLFDLTISNGNINQNHIDVAKFEKTAILPLLFFNQVIVENISLIQFAKYKIEIIKIDHSILSPTNIYIESKGTFGSLTGTFEISSKNLDLRIEASKILKSDRNIIKLFKKSKEGANIYEYHAKF